MRTFEEWYGRVVEELIDLGFHLDDLPDCPYQVWYKYHITPKKAAKMAAEMVYS